MLYFVSLLRFLGWSLLAGTSTALMLASALYLYLSPRLPDVEALRDVRLQTPLRIYSRDNQLIAEYGEKRRTPISIEDVPPHVIQAFLAAEDARFYDHFGIDPIGLMRATVQLISTGSIQSGGSTITMQVAKNYFLSQARTFTRKFNEIFLALKIEQELTKPEILELYLNKIYLGNRSYGIEAAANVYYGKSVTELSLAEAAMIAGLPKAPSRYNPIINPERALIRRDWILGRMKSLGYISEAEWQAAIHSPVTATYHGTRPDLAAPYVAEMARQKLRDVLGSDLYTGGYKAWVTVDAQLQRAARNALRSGLLAYSRRHGYLGPAGRLPEGVPLTQETINAQLKAFPKLGGLVPAVITRVSEDTAQALTRDMHPWTLPFEDMKWAWPRIDVNNQGPEPKSPVDILAVGDIVYIEPGSEARAKLAQVPQVQGALVSLNPEDGAILATVGGFDFAQSKYNRVLQARRQPGSNFKPFIYLAALEKGMTAATLINDAPIVFNDTQLETAWRPENSSGRFLGPTRLRKALYQSRNLVSIRLLRKMGIESTIETLAQYGFDTQRFPRDLSIALGSVAMTPLEVAEGYAMLANGGYRVKPWLIDHVEDVEGHTLWREPRRLACTPPNCPPSISETYTDAAPRVADERALYILNSMLQDVIRKGTGRRARSLGRPDLAGKTGTTNDQVDAWFSGYADHVVTSAWVGFDEPQTLGRREYGAKAALPIWMDYMREALKGKPVYTRPQPPGIVSIRIDARTGKPATPLSEETLFEYFREEFMPQANDSGNGDASATDAAEDSVPAELLF